MPAEEPKATHGPDLMLKSSGVILLNGTSSSGKTSLAVALQCRAGVPLLHASLDTFTDMYRWAAIPDPATRRRCHETGVDHFHHALRRFADGPHAIVVDHVLELPSWYAATRAALTGRQVYFVGVRCPLEQLEAREKLRPDRQPGMAASQFERVHRNMNYDCEIDTSQETPASGADKILAFIRQVQSSP
jgi:chloramphenicol 3-O phosphotransferase